MLKLRVVTALILAAIFLLALFWLPDPLFPAFVATVTLIGAWEWGNLAGLRHHGARLLYLLATGAVMAAAAVYLGLWETDWAGEPSPLAFRNLLVAGCLWWAVALLWVQSYPASALLWRSRAVRALMGPAVLVPAWAGLSWLRLQPEGVALLLLLMVVVACADICGYFTGRRWGRHKLAARVSPGKTWEGFAGGALANVLLAVVVGLLWQGSMLFWLAVIVPTSLVSVLGDLLESMVKRERGLKDSSALLPGHGGVLDRVDSLTSAGPVFALALLAGGWPTV